ncbi:hypothetical protein [Burkholderia territorii]|uniref:hypothetical protein n=1 Tax=Burkholderia territorii TaxID=1503055 RepID=UPI000753E250|nr:hypothetical protein [Burkholderia territorii]KWE25693.1 hypothetical protein WT49_02220 [Burkholderia territorii]KWE39192.1 hypothetical protein WT50_18275 [Burkholderia territorii]KWE52784.1 hypothetical protein WT51_08580 [Burkholderia territorii]
MRSRIVALVVLVAPAIALAQSHMWGIKSNQQLGGIQFTQPGASTAAKPANECQMKSAYAEFVVSNRQRGLPESAIPDLYGKKLDAAWKRRARGQIYSDANLALSDPMRVGEQVYRECQAAR